jgi:hypothetical protein
MVLTGMARRVKRQIAISMLWNEQGEAVSSEVFRGNRQDTQRFAAQVKKGEPAPRL